MPLRVVHYAGHHRAEALEDVRDHVVVFHLSNEIIPNICTIRNRDDADKDCVVQLSIYSSRFMKVN
jgi:hypothetical protein